MELKAALFAINGPDVPFVVRETHSQEKGDLVAEWRVLEPAMGYSFSRKQVERTIKTSMRLDALKCEVRTYDEQWERTWVGDPPRLALSHEYGRGQISMVYREWTYERGPDGRRHKVETFRFDPREMKDPLQKAVLESGWTWRPVLRKL
ncbi:hypothetical protein LKL35_35195 [Streptomyces sp. ET3-23]|uniref:hypothetical protein n=1 Tax=Streptomyces sp. ET3-23 TaxID=2885643 RepID=UPI001D101F7D|nr:hypothetical protein [Streptomyces sp. ET3-23]MCC2280613.1 hypothetical protein [Streptomyces sp. ET3-23]